MEPSIAGLFPDHFVDSELGEIPAGWEVKALGELTELAYGKKDLPSVAADSAVPGLNRNLAYMNRQLVPDKLVVEEFNRYVSEIFTRSHRLEEESRTLAALRDALLPKLISGEIRVNTQGAASEAIGEHQ